MSASAKHFQLFISGRSPNSQSAVAALRRTLGRAEFSAVQLETIDVEQEPERAREMDIVRTPTLVALATGKKLIGDLTPESHLIAFLHDD